MTLNPAEVALMRAHGFTQYCQHGAVAPCWRCDGLDRSEWLVTVQAILDAAGQLTHVPGAPASRSGLPRGLEPVRNQDVPNSANAGDYYVSQRGKVWLLCVRGPNWSLVWQMDSLPAGAAARAKSFIRGSARANKRDKVFALARSME